MSFKNKNIVRQFPFFTHFACLPFIQQTHRALIQKIQQLVQKQFGQNGFKIQQTLKRHSHLLSHLTMFMLTLKREQVKKKLVQILQNQKQIIIKKLLKIEIDLGSVKYFTRTNKNQKCQEITVIYLQIDQNSTQILNQLVDYFIRILISKQIITNEQLSSMRVIYNHKQGKFYPQTYHISLFRCKSIMQRQITLKALEKVNEQLKQLKQKYLSKFECKSLDIATMMEFDTNNFYMPLHSIKLNQQQIKPNLSKQILNKFLDKIIGEQIN